MSAFAAAVDAIFADANMAADALWLAGGVGPGVPVRVMRRAPDAVTDFGTSRALSATALIDVRVSEIAAPRPGDRVTIGTVTYVLQGEPARDAERLVWSCQTKAD